jgi:hypothetical protein
MDRFGMRRGSYLLTFLSLTSLVAITSGCASALATAMYVIRGTNVEAEFDGLKDKRVAVVCRPPTSLAYTNANTAPELAKQVGLRLSKNVAKIEVIDQQEVAEWTDENTWDDYVEIGRALEADMVVGIDLEDFTLYQGQTLYQGKASVRIKVYDLADDGRVVYEKIPPQSIYPPNTGIPTQEKIEAEFGRQYIGVLAEEIARHFYDHDSRVDFAIDSTAIH